jgi:5'-nucleotidase
VYVNEIFFLGGVPKSKVVKAFRAHIFFDDQDLHLDPAAKHVPSGRVPYRSDSPLFVPAAVPSGAPLEVAFDAAVLADEPPLLVEKLETS